MSVLEAVRSPDDLRDLTYAQIELLAQEIRDFLIDSVYRTGGHLGPNLGAVELTLALHRVFHSPHDRILWDTGHQAYVHKIVTGRLAGFSRLRKAGGLSGYPNRNESVHDLIENSHASTALSYADGLAKAHQLRGDHDRSVVAVVGDGALTGGMAWEATNNIAGAKHRPTIVVINDNGRSYAPTVGGLADHLTRLRAACGEGAAVPPVDGEPRTVFDHLGLPYVGPIDGHNVAAIEDALRYAKGLARPVVVHCVTSKGYGYPPALEDELDHLHAVKARGPGASSTPTGVPWTRVFAEELVRIGTERPDVVAITAAMLEPTGLASFAARFPERTYDVGLAEQHAVASAAGLAIGGLHPVVAIYSTFLNRAFDQVLLDVALHRCPVTFVLDRSGITGEDGPSHNGMWDLSVLQVVPGLRIAAPRDAATLREELRESMAVDDGPTVVRFPKGTTCADIPVLQRLDGMDVLRSDPSEDILLVAIGAMSELALAAADQLGRAGYGVSVVDPRWVKPLSPTLPKLAARYQMVATVEDNVRTGGVGCAVAQTLRDAGVHPWVLDFGLPERFFGHGGRADILADAALTPEDVARSVARQYARLNIEYRAEVPL